MAARNPGLTVVGVAGGGILGRETEEHLEAFRRRTGVTFPFYWDPERSLEGYAWPDEASAYPRQVLVDERSVIRYLAAEHRPDELERAVRSLL